jgi:GT2 family glycosyltransferase
MPPDPIEFSVIIPSRNRPRQLGAALRAISETTLPYRFVEVIVVADGRGQGLDSVVAGCKLPAPVELIEQEHQGPGAARNAGATRARGRYLAFTDDDCLPSPGWLNALKQVLDQSPGALVGGLTSNALEDNVFSEASHVIHQIVYRHYNAEPERASFLASNNMALRAEDFAQIGGFDPSFRLAAEDREFCDRWRWDGRPMIYAASALVLHEHDLTLRGFCAQHFRYGRGAARYHQTRARRGSGKFAEHLSFHRRIENWLTPEIPGGIVRQGQIRLLLFVWQTSNAAGFCWERLLLTFGRGAA